MASICASSRSSMRATGTPFWIVRITVSTASAIVGQAQTAAERGVGAGVDREEQSGIAQIFVELLARDARLDGGVEILGVDAEHPVHLRQVDADATLQRCDMSFERGAGAERDDRRLVLGAQR